MKRNNIGFKKRYILAEGFPWAVSKSAKEINTYLELQMRDAPFGGSVVPLDFPKELWCPTLPKYRLILERVE